MRPRFSLFKWLLLLPVRLLILVAWLWAAAGCYYFPGLPQKVQIVLCAALGLSTIVIFIVSRGFFRFVLFTIGFVALGFALESGKASNEHQWNPMHARSPSIVFDGNIVTIKNFRNFNYRSVSDFAEQWEERTIDLNTVEGVDYVIQPFAKWRGLAHTFVTFRFTGGTNLTISVEARRELDEEYHPVAGLFHHFELLYLIGSEKDLIGSRASIREYPIYLFPTRATSAEARTLLKEMLERAQALTVSPEYYQTAFKNCTTTVIGHVNQQRTNKIRFDWRVYLPGYVDELAFELGLIDFNGSLKEARPKCRIYRTGGNELAEAEWSKMLREQIGRVE